MNKQYDIIIIGDSPEGAKALKQLATASQKLKIAFVSTSFKSSTTRDFLNVEYIKDTVALIDYRAQLFGCYLDSGVRLYCTHIIIASGLAYAPFKVHGKTVPSVFNTYYDIPRTAKALPAVVVGRDTAAVRLALEVAKKYKIVYLCSDTFELDCSEALNNKIAAVPNVVVLPNAIINKFCVTDNKLTTIELSNYATLTCHAIFVKTAATPETKFIPNNIVKKDANGYCIVSESAESTLVPKCFVIGSAATKSTAKQKNAMVDAILTELLEV